MTEATILSRCVTLQGVAECILCFGLKGHLENWARAYLQAIRIGNKREVKRLESILPQELQSIKLQKEQKREFWSSALLE